MTIRRVRQQANADFEITNSTHFTIKITVRTFNLDVHVNVTKYYTVTCPIFAIPFGGGAGELALLFDNSKISRNVVLLYLLNLTFAHVQQNCFSGVRFHRRNSIAYDS